MSTAEVELHVVSSGELLNQIAFIYGATASAISDANSMANSYLIFPGEEIGLIAHYQEKLQSRAPRVPPMRRAPALVTGRARARRHDRVGSTSFSVARPWGSIAGRSRARWRSSPLAMDDGSAGLHRHQQVTNERQDDNQIAGAGVDLSVGDPVGGGNGVGREPRVLPGNRVQEVSPATLNDVVELTRS